MNVVYSITNASESDVGKYSCVVDGEGRRVQSDRELIITEEIRTWMSVPWWNATQV